MVFMPQNVMKKSLRRALGSMKENEYERKKVMMPSSSFLIIRFVVRLERSQRKLENVAFKVGRIELDVS